MSTATHPLPTGRQFIDLTGRTFGRLTVVSFAGVRGPHKLLLWRVQCSCGSPEKSVWGNALRNGTTRSCGCFNRERAAQRGERLIVDGEEKYIKEWARIADITVFTIRYRLKAGWTPEQAVFAPPQGGVRLQKAEATR